MMAVSVQQQQQQLQWCHGVSWRWRAPRFAGVGTGGEKGWAVMV
jgi:hypothetical protein